MFVLERFPAKWVPVRVKKTRQTKMRSLRSDSIGTEKALGERPRECSERAADRQWRDVPRSRCCAPSGRRVGVGNIAALNLGVDAAYHAFGDRVRGCEHRQVDLQHGTKQ